MNDEQRQALARIATSAVAVEEKYGVPAELTAAQCILETGYLQRIKGNNCFGIKYSERHSQSQILMTHEHLQGERIKLAQRFAAYDDIRSSFDDYAWLISNGKPYANAWACYQLDKALTTFIKRVARVYATDPEYFHKIDGLAHNQIVVEAIASARGKQV